MSSQKQEVIHLSGFVWALEILENSGKIFEPWKPLEKPWNFFIKPWKISQNFIEKVNSQNGGFLLISLQIKIEIVEFRIISKLRFVLETTA